MYPQWLDHLGPCGNRISWTRFISVANLLAFFAHLGGVIVAAVVNNEDGDFSQPSIDVYIPSIDFQRQSKGAGASFELKPVLEKLESPLSLRWLAISFFAISAFFHLVIFVDAAFIGRFYFKLIHECKAPFRWIEYSVSASVMLWTIAFAGGLKDIYLLVTLAVLCFVTMTYGYFTEALSRPNMNLDESRTKYYVVDGKIHENRDFQRVARSEQQDESPIVWGTPVEGSVFKSIVFKDGFYGPPTKWLTRSPWERLRPHLLGYIPYLTAYGIILHSFYHNTSGNEQGPPRVGARDRLGTVCALHSVRSLPGCATGKRLWLCKLHCVGGSLHPAQLGCEDCAWTHARGERLLLQLVRRGGRHRSMIALV